MGHEQRDGNRSSIGSERNQFVEKCGKLISVHWNGDESTEVENRQGVPEFCEV